MKTEYRYIHFVEVSGAGSAIKRFSVRNNKSREQLGLVRWYGQWRRYCFFPEPCCVFNADCLSDIREFMAQLKAGGEEGEEGSDE